MLKNVQETTSVLDQVTAISARLYFYFHYQIMHNQQYYSLITCLVKADQVTTTLN